MDIHQKSDEELIENVKEGCMDSFETLYERYKAKIYNYLYHLIENKQSAEDCTHDVFIHLYKNAAMYSPKAKFSSWLYRMAKNMAFDLLRKSKIRRAVSLDKPLESFEDAVPLSELLSNQEISPAKAAESAEIVNLVRAGISRLNDKDKQIVLLCDIEGLSHREVGEILGYPTETITVKLYRARRRLGKILKLEGLF